MNKYKQRADGRYLAQIKIGYQDNGKPKLKNIYAKSKAELDRKVTEYKSQVNKGIILDDKNMTVEEWADSWLNIYKDNVGFNTKRRYENIINQQIKPYIGFVKLSKLRLAEVQALINELSPKYSYSTVKKVKETLHQMYTQAIRNGFVYVNPADGVQLPKNNAKERQQLTEGDISKLKFFCRNYRSGALIMTLLYTGMRRGEILALTWNDIDFDKNIITVNKAVEFRNNQPYIKPPKTKKGNRTIPLLFALRPYLLELKQRAVTDTVFVNTHNQPHSDTSIKRLWSGFLKEYNEYLKKEEEDKATFTMHQFRHTYATLLYKAGVDVKTAQEFLGHSSVNITLDIYTHLEEKTREQGAEKMNDFISNMA